MTPTTPLASIVIPTYNRFASLLRTLDALQQQSAPAESFEVLVVSDGSTDGTQEKLASYQPPYRFRFIEQANQGPAAARNHGAAQAHGQWLIFLDDDIVVRPGFVAAHLEALQAGPDRVVIGYLPPILEKQAGYFQIELRGWWEAMFGPMRYPGYRFRYTNLLTGNFSLAAAHFSRLGGFNITLRCHEDYEFGLRLIDAQAAFTFSEQACGEHHEITDLDRSLRRKFQEGQADVQIGQLHPSIRSMLPLAYLGITTSRRARLLRQLAFKRPAWGDFLAARYRRTLDRWEALGRYWPWRTTLYDLLDYWYWRSVALSLPTRQALATFVGQATAPEAPPGLELDLSAGLPALERQLDQARPASLRLRYGPHFVGEIPHYPGHERIRGVHLRRFLASDLCVEYLNSQNAAHLPADAPADPHFRQLFLDGWGQPVGEFTGSQ